MYVTPAFETDDLKADELPRTKHDLLNLNNKNKIKTFHSYYKSLHAPTRYKKWEKSDSVYMTVYKPRFEPYVLLFHQDSPRFDERFKNRYVSKI